MLQLLKSKTVWGAVVMLIGAACHVLGAPFTEADEQAVSTAISLGVDAVGAFVVVWGRLTAKGPISLTGSSASALALLLAGSLTLAACAGTDETRATNALGIACQSYAAALNALGDRKATLSRGQVDKINSLNKMTDPFCSSGSPFDPATGVAVVEKAIAIIKQLK